MYFLSCVDPFFGVEQAGLPKESRLSMYVRYEKLIKETENDLVQLERRYRNSSLADRIKMLRLLKSGLYSSRQQLAPVLGYSARQLQRWWDIYQNGGIDALLEEKPVGGSDERITEKARAALEEAARSGKVTSLREVQGYLDKNFNIKYRSLQGISDLLKRHRIDLKSGRSRN